MAIFTRIVDILKANINDLLDKAEDPEIMLKQIVIDMEEQFHNATQGLGQLMGSERQVKKELEEAVEESAMWEERAKAALKAGDENLARKAVATKLKSDSQAVQLTKMHDELSNQVDTVREQVDALKQKLEETRSHQAMLIARAQIAEARQSVAEAVGGIGSSGAFSKIDKLEEKIQQKEAIADAQCEISGLGAPKNDSLAKLENEYTAENELERLKRELSKE